LPEAYLSALTHCSVLCTWLSGKLKAGTMLFISTWAAAFDQQILIAQMDLLGLGERLSPNTEASYFRKVVRNTPVWCDVDIGVMTPRREGGMWLFAGERGLEVMRDKRWGDGSRTHPQFMDPYVLLEDTRGTIWIATTRQGLVRLPPTGMETRFFTGNGFPTDALNCLFEDREGNIWVGGNCGGLVRLSRRQFSTIEAVPGMPSSVGALSLAEDRSGALWIGFFKGKFGDWTRFPLPNEGCCALFL
jgi:ligand-binding sensor domain-containing protein